MAMKCVNDFRLRFGKQELVPIMIGGMGLIFPLPNWRWKLRVLAASGIFPMPCCQL